MALNESMLDRGQDLALRFGQIRVAGEHVPCDERIDAHLLVVGKRVIAGPHVGELRLATACRDHHCRENGCLCRDTFERTVRVPLLIADQ